MSNLADNADLIKEINKQIEIKNNQMPIAKRAWYLAVFFFLIIFSAFSEIIEIHPAIVMISIFLFIMSVIIGFMYRSRGKKLQNLISGDNLIASWILTPDLKKAYVNTLFEQRRGMNMLILLVISVMAIVIFGLFILFIDEGKLFMFEALIGLIAFLSIFAFGMPYYYRYKNMQGDGYILIGKKYAYVNGFFHNWDLPLSGIKRVRIIKKPFYGLSLVYYYTDRTLKHSEELIIPANENVDLEALVKRFK